MAHFIAFVVLLMLSALSSATLINQVIHVDAKHKNINDLNIQSQNADSIYSLVIDEADAIKKEREFFSGYYDANNVIPRFDDGSLISADIPAEYMRIEDKDFNKDLDNNCANLNSTDKTKKCDTTCSKCAIKKYEENPDLASEKLKKFANVYYKKLYKGLGIKLVEKMIENIENYGKNGNTKTLFVYRVPFTTLRAFAGTVQDEENMDMIMKNVNAFEMKYDDQSKVVSVFKFESESPTSNNHKQILKLDLNEFKNNCQKNKADICSISNKEGLKEMKCDVKNEKPPTIGCLSYRRNCWKTACPQNSILNADTYICEGAKAESEMPTSSAGAMAACTTLGGILVGAGMMFAIQFYKSKR